MLRAVLVSLELEGRAGYGALPAAPDLQLKGSEISPISLIYL